MGEANEIRELLKCIKEVKKNHSYDVWDISYKVNYDHLKLSVSLNGDGLVKTYTPRKIKNFKENPAFEIEKDIYKMKRRIDKFFDPFNYPINEEWTGDKAEELYDAIYDTLLYLRFNCNTYDIYMGTDTENKKYNFYMQSRENPDNKWFKPISFSVFERICKARGMNYIPVLITDLIMEGYLKKEDTGFRAIMDKKVPLKKEEWNDGSENIEDIQKKFSAVHDSNNED